MDIPPCPDMYNPSWLMRGGTYYLTCVAAPLAPPVSLDTEIAEARVFYLQFIGGFALVFFICSIFCCYRDGDEDPYYRRYPRTVQRI
jgi:hypothetical protein